MLLRRLKTQALQSSSRVREVFRSVQQQTSPDITIFAGGGPSSSAVARLRPHGLQRGYRAIYVEAADELEAAILR
jgi:hypothetical protein